MPDGTPIRLGVSDFARDYITGQADSLMDSTIRISTPGTVYDIATRRNTTTSGAVKYEGPARIWEQAAGSVTMVGDDEIVMSQAYMSIPWDAPVPHNDDLTLIVDSSDPDLVGRTVNIDSVSRGGSLTASRQFRVTLSVSKRETW